MASLRKRLFRFGPENRRESRAGASSNLVVVVADADHVGDVVVLLFLVLEECVVVIVQFDIVDIVAEIGQIVAALGLIIGLFERNDFGAFLLGVDFLLLDLV